MLTTALDFTILTLSFYPTPKKTILPHQTAEAIGRFNPALVPWGQYDPRLFDRLNIPNV